MPLTLARPIVFFDLETTGTDVQNDRIVQISLLKLHPANKEEILTLLVNPGIPIPAEASVVHGITDDDVKDEPNFQARSQEIFNFLNGCDISGFNIHKFDLPLLRFEFNRVGINYQIADIKVLDPMVIFMKKEPRDLTAAYRFYCNQELEGAHDAENDIRATKDIFLAQIERYDDIGENLEEIAAFSTYNPNRPADITGKLLYNEEGNLIFNFGKHSGALVTDHLDYARWMVEKGSFAEDTKEILRPLL